MYPEKFLGTKSTPQNFFLRRRYCKTMLYQFSFFLKIYHGIETRTGLHGTSCTKSACRFAGDLQIIDPEFLLGKCVLLPTEVPNEFFASLATEGFEHN